MKVGIITFHCAPSYGAFFQAYALARMVQKLGHEAEVIDYMPAHRKVALEKSWRYPVRSSHRFGLNRVAWLSARERGLFYKAARRYLPLSREQFTDIEALRRAELDYDVCIVGSDQIWNPDHTAGVYDPAYFGQFGPEQMRRVSYAASFGAGNPEPLPPEVRGWLQGMDDISVREVSAAQHIKQEIDSDAEVVLDPTLLLSTDDYPKRRKPLCSGHYVLVYNLACDQSFRELSLIAAQHCGGEVVDLMHMRRSAAGSFAEPPEDALDMIRNATFVLTNSFHGCALAILHRVPFFVVSLSGLLASRADRLLDMLGRIGLSARYIDNDLAAMEACLFSPIDWTNVQEKLAAGRKHSRGVLTRFLHAVP